MAAKWVCKFALFPLNINKILEVMCKLRTGQVNSQFIARFFAKTLIEHTASFSLKSPFSTSLQWLWVP